jgi:exo-1,4-beta-D-glucosaminidase
MKIGVLLLIAVMTTFSVAQQKPIPASRVSLSAGWQIQSSAKLNDEGNVISAAPYVTKGWYPAAVPTTVLAALIANRVYADPYFGMNLRSIPGTTYPIGKDFSILPTPADSPFVVPWWYRTTFRIPTAYRGKSIALHFDGINFRANIWLNGKQIASSDKVAGTYRVFEFDVTDVVSPTKINTLAVEIFPPQPNDLAMTYVDWNPMPPDKNMGIWRDIYLTASGPVALRHPQVVTKLNLPATHQAQLSINVDLQNTTSNSVKGTLRGEIGRLRFAREVELAANEAKSISFLPEEFAQLKIANPRLWWPVQMGAQNLYRLKLTFEMGRKISDQVVTPFGIRQVTSEITDKGARLFKINGKNVLIRGAGWTPDMMLRRSPQREEDELRYVKDMNLNTVRLEGKMETDHFFDLADQYGILVMSGWTCCNHWEEWSSWKPEDHEIAAGSLSDQVLRLRNHPSLFVWLYGSDGPPPAVVEQMYLDVLKKNQWPNPSVSSASATPTALTGPTGVKMSGPYDWVPPNYWLMDTSKYGGAFGFNTETGPGPAVPPIESVRKMLPQDHLWPIDDVWNYHAGGSRFTKMTLYNDAIDNRYGKATSAEDYAKKSQLITYEGERAMFEAYSRNKYTSTGVIQWMLNNAWPSTIWHLYDYYLRPGGGYFGTKKACEPVHIQYSYDDRSVVVVNSLQKPIGGLNASAKVYDFNLNEMFSKNAAVQVAPDAVQSLFTIPEQTSTTTYFVKLDLTDSAGKSVSSNFYWLSTAPDVLDWAKTVPQLYTPVSSYADLTALQKLPPANIKASARRRGKGDNLETIVTLENPSKNLALAVELRMANKKGGADLLPVIWEENYFTLFPGEKKSVSARYRTDKQTPRPTVEINGWNVTPVSIPVASIP